MIARLLCWILGHEWPELGDEQRRVRSVPTTAGTAKEWQLYCPRCGQSLGRMGVLER